jgi:ferritin-like metal-binding protein YciE
MKGLLEEGEEVIDMNAEADVRDAGLIAAAQKVEHYEMAAYGCLCTWADQLGHENVRNLLHETLEEEKQTDAKLTELAEQHVNAHAAMGTSM